MFGLGELWEGTDMKRYRYIGSIKTVLLLKVKVSALFSISCETASEVSATETTFSTLRHTSMYVSAELETSSNDVSSTHFQVSL